MLYGLHQLYKDNRACYESGYFGSHPYSEYILESIKHINKEIRPVALSIIEGTADVPDDLVLSAIGNSYGDIYETHLRWAKNSRLNKTKLGDAIPDGYMEYMMPILKAKM